MAVAKLTLGGAEYVVVPKGEFRRLQQIERELRREEREDVAVSLRRLRDRKERRVPWSAVKRAAGLG